MTRSEFVNELKSCGFRKGTEKDFERDCSDTMYLLTRETCKTLNRELLLKFDLFEKKLRLLDLFHDFDTDKNETLSEDEFHHALSQMGFEKSEINSMFDNFDTDNDGKISLSEFVKAFETFLMQEQNDQEKKKDRVPVLSIHALFLCFFCFVFFCVPPNLNKDHGVTDRNGFPKYFG